MDKKSNRNEEDMSMTFVGEINQKSAIAKEKKEQEKKNLRIEDLSQEEEQNPLEKDFSSNEGEEELFSSKPKQNKKSPIFIIFLFLLILVYFSFLSPIFEPHTKIYSGILQHPECHQSSACFLG